jgi:SEC-C motif-containing protein
MRSRYMAYVLGKKEYLLATWHPSARPPALNLAAGGGVEWLGLEVVRTEAGTEGDTQGVVEFVARYKRQGRATRLHEVSRFVRENGQWFYVEGVHNDRRSRKPVQRR